MPTLYRPRTVVHPSPAQVAEWIKGTLFDEDAGPAALEGMGTLETAEAREIAFISDRKWAKSASGCKAGLFIVPVGTDLPDRARIEVKHVWSAVATVMQKLYPDYRESAGIHRTALVGKDSMMGQDVEIGPYCVIGDGVRIGDRVRIGAGCSIDDGCVIGSDTRLHAKVALQGHVELGRNNILHSGVTLGADGFRYEAGPAGILKIPQVGAVILEDNVEVGANSTIDRAFIHETRIGYGTKIDNQVQIGHNCRIGKFCLVCGCVGIAGSVTVGDGVVLGGGVGVRDGLTIGSGAQIAGGSQLGEDVPAGGQVMGYAAFPARDFMKSQLYFRRLPELARRLAAIERKFGSGVEPGEGSPTSAA